MILRDRLSLATSYINLLKGIRRRVSSPSDLLQDPVLRGAVERYLHLSIEALIDVGMRLCSQLRLRRPERYRDLAGVLMEAGALRSSAAERFEQWIGFRNILVHGYAVIDYRELYRALGEVEELEEIALDVARYVGEKHLDPEPPSLNKLVETIRRVLERGEVEFAYLFGSRARGKASEHSDVDVAVYIRGNATWRHVVNLKHRLEDALGLEVDVVILNKASPLLAYEAIAKGILVIDKDPTGRVEFEAKVLKEYLDLKPRLEHYYREVFSQPKSNRSVSQG